MLTERTEKLRDKVRNGEHAIHRITMPDSWTTAGLSVSLCERKALAVKLVAEKMPIYITEGELLVGSKTVFGSIPDGTDNDKHRLNPLCFPHYATDDEKRIIGGIEGNQKNHCLPSYQMALRYGLDGLRMRVIKRIGEFGVTEAQKEFLRSTIIAYDSVTVLAERYAELAASMATENHNAELLNISRVCLKVAHSIPETLQEAMQLYLFVYFTVLIEQGPSVGHGRVDQMFMPYTQGLSDDEINELVACFLIKLNDCADIDLGDLHYNGEDSIILCGVKEENGEDATNFLSYKFIDIFGDLHLSAPMPCIRVASTTPDSIIERTINLNMKGINSSALYNDDEFVRALHAAGIPIEDARSWGLDLCQDVQIGGSSDIFIGAQFSLLQPILDSLRNSPDNIEWQEFYSQIKKSVADDIKKQLEITADYEECANSWPEDKQVFERAEENGKKVGKNYHSFYKDITHMLSPYPILSAFIDGCFENARDVINGGARYRNKGVFGLVPTTAINSLSAIKHCVFEEKELTLSQVVKAIDKNFDCMEDVRLMLLNAPKWGNDDDRCDALAKDYIEFALKEVGKYTLSGGVRFLGGVHQPHTQAAGKNYSATPDGRYSGEPIPVTISPTNGTDICGPTAVMNSVSKLDPILQQWNAALTISFDGTGSEDQKQETVRTISALIRGYFDKGGMEIQPNIYTREELIDAQMHPENHKDLLVRVWGVSMYFIELSRDWQNEIIQRTIHQV